MTRSSQTYNIVIVTAPTVCPKCQRERRAGEDACAKCGLLVSRWAGFANEIQSHPLLDALWGKVEESWEDDARHARFLDEAAAAGALDLAAARYATRLRQHSNSEGGSDSDSDPRARAGLERATRLALQLQKLTADSDLGQAARWLKVAGAAVAIALFAATLWVLFQSFRR
jgi:hypothetical protein